MRLAGGCVAHLLDVAMVCGNQHLPARGLERLGDSAQAHIQGFYGLHRRGEIARVANHVAVGEVANNGVVGAAGDGSYQLVGDLLRTHLRCQVVSTHFR